MGMKAKIRTLSVFLGGLLLLTGCASGPPLTLAKDVDLHRYAGRWYVIANIPYFAERGNVGTWFDVTVKHDGTLADVYNYRAKNFDAPRKTFTMNATVVPGTGNARWRESPFWPIYLSYLILYVDPDYQTALVGYPGRGYGWVFARNPVIIRLGAPVLAGAGAGRGYDIGPVRRVPQTPAQIGRSGFQ